jgi:hypothetical protein
VSACPLHDEDELIAVDVVNVGNGGLVGLEGTRLGPPLVPLLQHVGLLFLGPVDGRPIPSPCRSDDVEAVGQLLAGHPISFADLADVDAALEAA